MKIHQSGSWLSVHFECPHDVLSWALQKGGAAQTDCVAWYQVAPDESGELVDAARFINERFPEAGFSNAVGLLTSANLADYKDVEKTRDGLSARCIATVCMSNALRAGDPPSHMKTGTINLLCVFSAPLLPAARLEVLSIAVEARTAAVMESGIASVQSGLLATGTGTDCIVVASPCAAAEGKEISYAGKHTTAGHVAGRAVFEAVAWGLNHWKDTNIQSCHSEGPSLRSRVNSARRI